MESNGNHKLMSAIERLRSTRKITIAGLTKGIMSSRNYSRLLSDSAKLRFNDLLAFLTKLDISVNEFAAYVYNHDLVAHAEELTLLELINNRQFKEANEIYERRFANLDFHSQYAKKLLPISIMYMRYHMNRSTKLDAYYKIKELIRLDEILASKVLISEDLDCIRFFLDVCSDNEKTSIGNHLIKVIDQDIKLIASLTEAATMTCYDVAIQAFGSKDVLDDRDHDRIAYVFRHSMAYQFRAKLSFFDISLFSTMYHYIRRFGIDNPLLVHAHIASIMSSVEFPLVTEHKHPIRDEDVRVFLNVLDERKLRSDNIYKELLS
jgi:hypothetical protein